MGYLKIPNLYADATILLFKEVYALEKVHGTSAHIAWKEGTIHFFAGGADHKQFFSLFRGGIFDEPLKSTILPMTVYGEAYGGKCQGMSKHYGKDLRFVAFDVQVGDTWLNVPEAAGYVRGMGLEFVHYEKIPATIEAINRERDADSVQACRCGMGKQIREGVVLRPLVEMRTADGSRVIAKHKRDEFRETTETRLVDPDKLKVLSDAQAIADEWVTPMRLAHVLDKLPKDLKIEAMRQVIEAMIADVLCEASKEIVDTREARSRIGKKTAELFKKHLQPKETSHDA